MYCRRQSTTKIQIPNAIWIMCPMKLGKPAAILRSTTASDLAARILRCALDASKPAWPFQAPERGSATAATGRPPCVHCSPPDPDGGQPVPSRHRYASQPTVQWMVGCSRRNREVHALYSTDRHMRLWAGRTVQPPFPRGGSPIPGGKRGPDPPD